MRNKQPRPRGGAAMSLTVRTAPVSAPVSAPVLAPVSATILPLVLCLAMLGGCGSAAGRMLGIGPDGKGTEAAKLPPVKPEAMREFDAGMRAIRLAGKRPKPDALSKAKERFAAAVKLDDKLWEGWYNLGVIHYHEGDDDAATDALSKALRINPGHWDTRLTRAEAHRRAGRTGDARGDYEHIAAKAPSDLPIKRSAAARLASLLREDKKYDDALKVLRDTLRVAGASAKVYVELGRLYMAQGQDELADLVLAKAIELDPKEPSIYNAQALLALARGKSQEAFDRFDYATSLDPNYLDARFNKASVLISAGDFKRAKADLKAVVDKSPDDLDARVALGVAHRGLGEYDLAKVQWQQVVDTAPRRSRARGDALFNLANLQMSFLENENEAAAAFERFLDESPNWHPKRKEAEQKRKELGVPAGPASPDA